MTLKMWGSYWLKHDNMASTPYFLTWKMERKEHEFHHHSAQQPEILKAVAQAWFSHHNFTTHSEFDARRLNFQGRPSRFRIEASRNQVGSTPRDPGLSWDFKQSLWDPYEIVAVSKRLEEGLVSDTFCLEDGRRSVDGRKRKEGKNSLKSLFDKFSSRRFNYSPITHQDR